MCPCSLDSKEHVLLPLWSFQGARGPVVHEKNATEGRSLKTQQRDLAREPGSRSTLFQASRSIRTAEAIKRFPTPTGVRAPVFPRKEVIQPQLPLRLPCYDFTPIINPTFDGCLLAVSSPASGIADFRGVTGGVYKPRVRIHRGVADPRLLATPPS